jgi:energy-coupling factor transporter transmembrane protein EcfT
LVEDLKKQISTGLSKGLRFNSKNLFVLMVVVTFTIIVDSEIGVVADFIPSQISSSSGIAVFILIAIIFVLGQYFIHIKQTNENTREGYFTSK